MTDLDDLPMHHPGESPAVANGARGRGKCRRHEPERTVAGMPWPVRCRVCGLVTEDPDAFFFPPDFDAEMIPEDCRCPGTTDGSHQAETRVRCLHCRAILDPIASRRSRNNGKRGRRAELDVARSIPGGRKMGSLGLPWDVEVGTYARLQVKKLASPPSANAITRLIRAIPDTGDRLRGFVLVEAAGQGKRGKRTVWFLTAEFVAWHGADFGPHDVALVTMPLADWVANFVEAAT